jgi:hypothetical protein
MADDVRVTENISAEEISAADGVTSYERLAVELKFMHEENDNINRTNAKEISDLRGTLEVMKDEYALNLDHMQEKLDDALRLIARKEALIEDKDIEILQLKDGADKNVIAINEQLEREEGKNANLTQKLSNATLLSERTMLAFYSQKELVDAKNEIIENLKKKSNMQK